jgi:hypothetical protein
MYIQIPGFRSVSEIQGFVLFYYFMHVEKEQYKKSIGKYRVLLIYKD